MEQGDPGHSPGGQQLQVAHGFGRGLGKIRRKQQVRKEFGAVPEAVGLLAVSHPHRQDQEGKLDIVQDRAGNGSQHSFPPAGFAVGADDDQGGAVFLGHSIQGAPRQTDGGLDDDLEALVSQDPPLGRQAGGGRGRQTFAGAAEEIRGDDVGQDDAGTPQLPEFAPASHDLVPSRRQIGGHNYPVKDRPHHVSLSPPSPWVTSVPPSYRLSYL